MKIKNEISIKLRETVKATLKVHPLRIRNSRLTSCILNAKGLTNVYNERACAENTSAHVPTRLHSQSTLNFGEHKKNKMKQSAFRLR